MKTTLTALAGLLALPLFVLAQATTSPAMPNPVQYVAPVFELSSTGSILVRGVVVSSVSSSTIEGTFMDGAWQLPVTIKVLPSTLYYDVNLNSWPNMSGIQVGDTISFLGFFNKASSTSSVMVTASVVRDWMPSLSSVGGGASSGSSSISSTSGASSSVVPTTSSSSDNSSMSGLTSSTSLTQPMATSSEATTTTSTTTTSGGGGGY